VNVGRPLQWIDWPRSRAQGFGFGRSERIATGGRPKHSSGGRCQHLHANDISTSAELAVQIWRQKTRARRLEALAAAGRLSTESAKIMVKTRRLVSFHFISFHFVSFKLEFGARAR